MSRIAIVDPGTLLGQSVRELLAADPQDHEIRLLDSSAEAEGTLTQLGSEVALVHALDSEALGDVDLVVLCGDPARQRSAIEAIDDSVPLVLFDRGDSPAGRRVVAGINDDAVTGGRRFVSPHPGVVLLSQLIAPLLALQPRRVAATLLLPTSLHDEPGLDELFEQTRGILNFQGEMPTAIFPAQLAFNLLPGAGGAAIVRQTAEVLGGEASVSVHALQAPVFHGLGASVHLETSEPVAAEALRQALDQSAYLELVDGHDTLGPIAAAAHEKILIGAIQPLDDGPTQFGLWVVMDNLTRGGAHNAVEIAQRVLADS